MSHEHAICAMRLKGLTSAIAYSHSTLLASSQHVTTAKTITLQ